MDTMRIEIRWEEWSLDALPEDEKMLVRRAVDVIHCAYAPYSGFRVGAALLLANGKVVVGSNQENAAFPAGLCAERVALFYAGTRFPDVPVRMMAVAARTNGQPLHNISPCGCCRQVLVETERRGRQPVRILLCSEDKIRIFPSAESLLPFSFSMD